MDTSVTPTPIPTAPPVVRAHQTLKRVAFVAILIAALITVVEFALPNSPRSGDSKPLPAPVIAPLAISLGSSPASPLYRIDHTTNELVPLTVMVNGSSLLALDSVRGVLDSSYYILAESTSAPITNLYQKKPDGSIVQLTHSPTKKFNISYDSTSGLFAYQTLSTTSNPATGIKSDGDLVVFDPAKNTETVVAKGSNPHLTLGGLGLIFGNDNKIETLIFSSHATSTAFALTSGSLYALSPDATQLSVYDPDTQKINHYQFTGGSSLFKVFSDTLTFKPTAIGYVGGYILAGYTTQKGNDTYLNFFRPDAGPDKQVKVKDIPNGLLQRIYAYE